MGRSRRRCSAGRSVSSHASGAPWPRKAPTRLRRMSELIVSSRPDLHRPVLLAGFSGWNDGGQGATLGAGYLARLWGAEEFATIDPENFYDFQQARPLVSLDDGLTRKLEWPA